MSDETHDARGRPLCCPYDAVAMGAFYGLPPDDACSPGRRAAMRKRLLRTLEEIAQRAAETRRLGA